MTDTQFGSVTPPSVILLQGPVGPAPMQSNVQEPPRGEVAPFSCNICKRNYSRVDHLARHYRSRE